MCYVRQKAEEDRFQAESGGRPGARPSGASRAPAASRMRLCRSTARRPGCAPPRPHAVAAAPAADQEPCGHHAAWRQMERTPIGIGTCECRHHLRHRLRVRDMWSVNIRSELADRSVLSEDPDVSHTDVLAHQLKVPYLQCRCRLRAGAIGAAAASMQTGAVHAVRSGICGGNQDSGQRAVTSGDGPYADTCSPSLIASERPRDEG